MIGTRRGKQDKASVKVSVGYERTTICRVLQPFCNIDILRPDVRVYQHVPGVGLERRRYALVDFLPDARRTL